MPEPKVTIFMAVYNGAKYLRQAMDSALNQTYRNFELLIIDDGSTDESLGIIGSYQDERIRLLRNDRNMGLFETRKRGVEEARGKYFATLDCDDIAPLNRLEIQLQYFKTNPESAVCAGRIKYIDEASNHTGQVSIIKGDQDFLRSLLIFTNFLYNSTTMIRTNILKEFQYRPGYEPAEDFDLFERITTKYQIGVLPDLLSYYRVHTSNTSNLKSQNRKRAEREIIERQLQRYGFSFTDDDIGIHLNFTTNEFEFDRYKVKDYAKWLHHLTRQNKEKKQFNTNSFNQAIALQWLRICKIRLIKYKDLSPFFEPGLFRLRTIVNLLGK